MCVSLVHYNDDVHVKLVTVTVYTLDHRSSYTSVTNPATEITPRRLITEQVKDNEITKWMRSLTCHVWL
jgi:hypothetical protein